MIGLLAPRDVGLSPSLVIGLLAPRDVGLLMIMSPEIVLCISCFDNDEDEVAAISTLDFFDGDEDGDEDGDGCNEDNGDDALALLVGEDEVDDRAAPATTVVAGGVDADSAAESDAT